MSTKEHILIIGAGFLGIQTAISLAKKNRPDIDITVVTKTDYFQYYPALYRIAVGSSRHVAQIPLARIFGKYPQITLRQETVTQITPHEKSVVLENGEKISYDTLVLGIGSERREPSIPGLEEITYPFSSVEDAYALSERVDFLFQKHRECSPTDQLLGFHFVIIGAGASGVELAGGLAQYTQQKAEHYGVDSSLITIDLIDGGSRVLGRLPEAVSEKTLARLRSLGVNVLLNRRVTQGESWTLRLKDMKLGTKTMIWTAGNAPHHMAKSIPGCMTNKRGKLVVNEFLQPARYEDIYVGGDIADTPMSGLAQTAIRHGAYIATSIMRAKDDKKVAPYTPKKVASSIPVGSGWGTFSFPPLMLAGRVAFWIRMAIDLKYLSSILSIPDALRTMRGLATSTEHDNTQPQATDK